MAFTMNLITVCVVASFFAATVLAQDPCTAGEAGTARQVNELACSKNYEVCRTNYWRTCSCVLGSFNLQEGKCDRFPSNCPDTEVQTYYPETLNGRKKRSAENNVTSVILESRTKRQAVSCPSVYDCPSNINKVIVYPDWEQSSCNTFNLCYRGQLKKSNCNENFYYNPRLLSCEQYPALTNACVWRQFADYS